MNITKDIKANETAIAALHDQFQIMLNKLTIIECLFENIDKMMKDNITIKEKINEIVRHGKNQTQ